MQIFWPHCGIKKVLDINQVVSIYPQSLFKENVTSPKFMFMPYLAIDLSLRWALDAKSQCTCFPASVHGEFCWFIDNTPFQTWSIGLDFRGFVFANHYFKWRSGDFYIGKSDHNDMTTFPLSHSLVGTTAALPSQVHSLPSSLSSFPRCSLTQTHV